MRNQPTIKIEKNGALSLLLTVYGAICCISTLLLHANWKLRTLVLVMPHAPASDLKPVGHNRRALQCNFLKFCSTLCKKLNLHHNLDTNITTILETPEMEETLTLVLCSK